MSTPLVESDEAPRAVGAIGRNALWGQAQCGINILVAFFLTPYLIHTLGEAAFGLQVLALQVLQFCQFLSGGLGIAYVRLAAVHHARGEHDRVHHLLGTAFTLTLLSTAVLMGCAGLVAWRADVLFDLDPEAANVARVVLLVGALGMMGTTLLGPWESPGFFLQRLHLDHLAKIVTWIATAGLTVAWFRLVQPSVIAWVAIAATCTLIARLVFVVLPLRRAYPGLRIRPHWDSWNVTRSILGLGLFTFLGSLVHLLYYATDAILICNLDELGASEVAAYNLGARWDPMVRNVLVAWIAAMAPTLVQRFATGDEEGFREQLLRGTRIALALALLPCVTMVAFARPFLHHWVGERFVERSGPVLVLLLAALFFAVPAMMAYQGLLARGKVKGVIVFALVCGVANVILSVVFVRVFHLGLLGVALGTAVTLLARNVFYTPWVSCRAAELPFGRYLREGWAPALIAGLPLAAFAFTLANVWPARSLGALVIPIGACVVAWAALVWTVVLTRNERSLLRRALLRWRRSAVTAHG
ncbi:MAG: oligosaccharide flippase family protein [Planctomycetes bacterium]|nr:oligosaccharide flippase family protein [Planctomycetota bacterium]MCB9891927.1 oligosaccharide flippase family protein [Planctomycetota bacterium]